MTGMCVLDKYRPRNSSGAQGRIQVHEVLLLFILNMIKHSAASLHTGDPLLKLLLPHVHLDEFDAVEDLVHGANSTVCDGRGSLLVHVDETGKQKLTHRRYEDSQTCNRTMCNTRNTIGNKPTVKCTVSVSLSVSVGSGKSSL